VILIAYDGAPDAKEAIIRAGELMSGKPAAVVTVWEQFEDMGWACQPQRLTIGGFLASGEVRTTPAEWLLPFVGLDATTRRRR
jgi:hypothetical protein